ncbi:MAG: hypothetical protein K5853_00495, partial [Lachnospiraceae bacterium]|nr:hypothetical protein [Lachnospiraceae bacterium]
MTAKKGDRNLIYAAALFALQMFMYACNTVQLDYIYAMVYSPEEHLKLYILNQVFLVAGYLCYGLFVSGFGEKGKKWTILLVAMVFLFIVPPVYLGKATLVLSYLGPLGCLPVGLICAAAYHRVAEILKGEEKLPICVAIGGSASLLLQYVLQIGGSLGKYMFIPVMAAACLTVWLLGWQRV